MQLAGPQGQAPTSKGRLGLPTGPWAGCQVLMRAPAGASWAVVGSRCREGPRLPSAPHTRIPEVQDVPPPVLPPRQGAPHCPPASCGQSGGPERRSPGGLGRSLQGSQLAVERRREPGNTTVGGGGPSGLAWLMGGRVVCLMKPACASADTHGEGISLGWAQGPCPVALGSWPQPLPAGHERQLAHGPVGAARGAGGWQGGLGPPELQLDPGGCVRAPATVDGQAGRREPGGPGNMFPLEPLPAPGMRGPGIPQTTVLLGWGRP